MKRHWFHYTPIDNWSNIKLPIAKKQHRCIRYVGCWTHYFTAHGFGIVRRFASPLPVFLLQHACHKEEEA